MNSLLLEGPLTGCSFAVSTSILTGHKSTKSAVKPRLDSAQSFSEVITSLLDFTGWAHIWGGHGRHNVRMSGMPGTPSKLASGILGRRMTQFSATYCGTSGMRSVRVSGAAGHLGVQDMNGRRGCPLSPAVWLPPQLRGSGSRLSTADVKGSPAICQQSVSHTQVVTTAAAAGVWYLNAWRSS